MWEKIMQGDFGTRDFWELICIVMDPTCEKTLFGKCKECMFAYVSFFFDFFSNKSYSHLIKRHINKGILVFL